MVLLDSDHLTVLKFRSSPRATQLTGRLALAATDGPIGTTIVSVEESMRGWLASVAKEKQFRRQLLAYRELAELFTFFGGFYIVLPDEAAAQVFAQLRAAKLRVGTSDRKIAAIALVQNALLLTANRRDFEQVPGLQFDNWMD